MLHRLRNGNTNQEDWKLLLTRQPSSVSNLKDFEDVSQLYYSNEEVAKYNYNKLINLEHPIASIHARHSSQTAKKMSPQDMCGLEPTLLIAKGALVMLTVNLWASVGLCNGAVGTVVDIVYQTNHQPPD